MKSSLRGEKRGRRKDERSQQAQRTDTAEIAYAARLTDGV
jgi:hypothetical protein